MHLQYDCHFCHYFDGHSDVPILHRAGGVDVRQELNQDTYILQPKMTVFSSTIPTSSETDCPQGLITFWNSVYYQTDRLLVSNKLVFDYAFCS